MSEEKFPKDFVCNHKKYLPCQFGYFDGEVHRCSYHRLWVLAAWINDDKKCASALTNKACLPIKEENNLKKYLIQLNKKNAEDILNNAKIDDVIFCSVDYGGDGEVVLLEKPHTVSGHCLYRNKKGEVKSCQVGHCRTISKGGYMSECHTKGKDSEVEAMMIRWKAIQAGFRVEIQKVKSGYLLKIFGDSQREVDDFMTMCVYNKFMLV